MMNRLHYGVCFYPEHWPWKTIVSDIRRIAECGFTFVRIGEGAWWYFEPDEGKYRFDLFDRVIDECRKYDIKIVFGTPTYCGPAWIGHRYPEVYRWDYQRTPMKHGSRRNYNYTSPKYLDLCDRIVTRLAEHYKREKQIIAWQIDNEFNCHMDVSYSPTDTRAFREWLRKRYRTLDNLNAAWGTRFWSQVYSDWDQIDLPHPTATYHNPTQLLDESRFISDTVIAFCKRQADILKKINPRWVVTHNGLFKNVDGPKLVEQLDFFSHDQYPMFWDEWTKFAAPLVQARSLSFPYAIMEQQSGPGGQMQYLLRTGRQGEMRLWAHQSFAHGAKALSYFCWRTLPFGTEQHWHGLLDYDGKDNNRIKQAKQVGEEIRRLPSEIWDAAPDKVVAILRDYDNEINDRRINTYTAEGDWDAGHWMTALMKKHVPVDQVYPGRSWKGYKILIAPHLKIVDQQLVSQLEGFVKSGGVLVLQARSGIKNRNLHMLLTTPPGLFKNMTGIEIEDWSNLKAHETRKVSTPEGSCFLLRGFVERIKLRTAEPLGYWDEQDDLLSGSAAWTIHSFGKGKVIYVGGYLTPEAASHLSAYLMNLVDYQPPIEAHDDVELIIRCGKTADYLWLLNHSGETQFTTVPPNGRDLLGKSVTQGRIKLAARDVAIVEVKKTD